MGQVNKLQNLSSTDDVTADLSISETCYQAKQSSENKRIVEWLIRVTENQRNCVMTH